MQSYHLPVKRMMMKMRQKFNKVSSLPSHPSSLPSYPASHPTSHRGLPAISPHPPPPAHRGRTSKKKTTQVAATDEAIATISEKIQGTERLERCVEALLTQKNSRSAWATWMGA